AARRPGAAPPGEHAAGRLPPTPHRPRRAEEAPDQEVSGEPPHRTGAAPPPRPLPDRCRDPLEDNRAVPLSRDRPAGPRPGGDLEGPLRRPGPRAPPLYRGRDLAPNPRTPERRSVRLVARGVRAAAHGPLQLPLPAGHRAPHAPPGAGPVLPLPLPDRPQ